MPLPRFGLALAASALSLAAAGVVQAQPTTIAIELTEYSFAPAEIDLVHGQAYVFHLTNSGHKDHDLSAKAFFATATLAPGAKVKNGDIDVDEDDSVDVALTPTTPGTYEMHCTKPFHAMQGMKGKIVVR